MRNSEVKQVNKDESKIGTVCSGQSTYGYLETLYLAI